MNSTALEKTARHNRAGEPSNGETLARTFDCSRPAVRLAHVQAIQRSCDGAGITAAAHLPLHGLPHQVTAAVR